MCAQINQPVYPMKVLDKPDFVGCSMLWVHAFSDFACGLIVTKTPVRIN